MSFHSDTFIRNLIFIMIASFRIDPFNIMQRLKSNKCTLLVQYSSAASYLGLLYKYKIECIELRDHSRV